MVSCRDIQERIERGEEPSSPEERAHLDTCETCRLLTDVGLRQDLASGLDLAGIQEAVRGEIADETGPVAFLRSRPTPVRLGVALGFAALVAVVVFLVTPRVDLALYPSLRMAVALALLVLPFLVALAVVLRPMQRHALHGVVVWGGLVVAVAVPWLLALLPRAHDLHPGSLRGEGEELLSFALRCLAFGVATGLPVLLALWALDRGGHAGLRRALVAAAAAGLIGNLALQLHCPITAPSHLVLGHATVGLVLLAGYALAAARSRLL